MTRPEQYELCYVEGELAYFAEDYLEAWGDDWDDVPYEHNAGTPYDKCVVLQFDCTEREGVSDVDSYPECPDTNYNNSPYSVKGINHNHECPWIRVESADIMAGTTVENFIQYMAESDRTTSVIKWIQGGEVSIGPNAEKEKERILSDCFLVTRVFLEGIVDYDFKTIADMGGGPGHHARYFQLCGKEVFHHDLLAPLYSYMTHISGDYSQRRYHGRNQYDAIWSHHSLEHVENVIETLICWNSRLKTGGYLFLCVPAIENNISKGHVVSFNIPLLMYLLSGTGYDCSEAPILRRDSHIQMIVRKRRHISKFSSTFQEDLLPSHVVEEIEDRGRFSCDNAVFKWIDGMESNIHHKLPHRIPTPKTKDNRPQVHDMTYEPLAAYTLGLEERMAEIQDFLSQMIDTINEVTAGNISHRIANIKAALQAVIYLTKESQEEGNDSN